MPGLSETGNPADHRGLQDSGCAEQVAVTPGFTRGLAFYERYAFIGVSKRLQAAEFGAGIPLAERPASERACGVWVADIVTGQTVAWLQFESGVEEIFSVEVIPQSQHPDLINHEPSLYSDTYVFPETT